MVEQANQFRLRIDALVEQVRRWVEPHEWVTKTYPKKMRDSDHRVYEVTALFLQKGPIRLLLDPVAYDVPGVEAVVDLYLMPTYDDMASLHFKDGRWMIHYPFPAGSNGTSSVFGADARILSEETLNQVLDSIAVHAEPSF